MRISDWSSDVCSSVLEDLHGVQDPLEGFVHEAIEAGALERQLETAATPPKELHPHMTLELADLAADRSLGNAQLLCRPQECSTSDDRRVGKGGVRTGRPLWTPSHQKKKTKTQV